MIIDGKKIAEEILAEVAKQVRNFKKPLRLVAVLVGENPGLRKFVELKRSAAQKVGIDFRTYEFPGNITTQELRRKIVEISKAQINSGVIVELPLPNHINAQYILNAISEEKDVDVLSQKSQGVFFAGRSRILPPAVEAVKTIFEKYGIEARGKNCAVFGYGLLVGKPISHWLTSQGATVTIINESTLDAKRYTLNADVIISGVGKPNLIKADMIKQGVVVIDFGYSILLEAESGKPETALAGDVDFAAVSSKASLITPVPGGIGPVVIAAVLKNLVKLSKE